MEEIDHQLAQRYFFLEREIGRHESIIEGLKLEKDNVHRQLNPTHYREEIMEAFKDKLESDLKSSH